MLSKGLKGELATILPDEGDFQYVQKKKPVKNYEAELSALTEPAWSGDALAYVHRSTGRTCGEISNRCVCSLRAVSAWAERQRALGTVTYDVNAQGIAGLKMHEGTVIRPVVKKKAVYREEPLPPANPRKKRKTK